VLYCINIYIFDTNTGTRGVAMVQRRSSLSNFDNSLMSNFNRPEKALLHSINRR